MRDEARMTGIIDMIRDLRERVSSLEARILPMKEEVYKAPIRPSSVGDPDTYDPNLFPWRNTTGY